MTSAKLQLPNIRPARGETEDKPRVAFVTLGCKVNQSDTQKAIAAFRRAGFRLVPPGDVADVYVVNTCSVTHVADRKSRAWLRRMSRANPNALVVATGCYAVAGRAALEGMPEVGLIVAPRDGESLLELALAQLPAEVLMSARAGEPVQERVAERIVPLPDWATTDGDSEENSSAWARDSAAGMRTRAMIKVEDGCNDFCTFCIIPFTRGAPRSTPTGRVISLVRERLAAGAREIVLTGVHMGKYGEDHAQRKRAASDPAEARDLTELVRAVLANTAAPRLRLTSVEPTDAPRLLPLFADPANKGRLARHMHLPLQSGSDATLARMKRGYTTAEYGAAVRQAREAVPGIAITTDVIVGFPGETEAEFAQTCDFVRRIGFSGVHVFPYSARPGTPALAMPGQVDHATAARRLQTLSEIGRTLAESFAHSLLGTDTQVLWEAPDPAKPGLWSGLTDNYVRVHTRSAEDLYNKITTARITGYDAAGLWAETSGQWSVGSGQ